MLSDSPGNFILIRTSIALLRSVAPASIGYVAFCGYRLVQGPRLSPVLSGFGIYALLESLFYLLVYLPRDRMMQKAAAHPPPLTKEERMALFKKCQQFLPDKTYPTGWFRAPGMKKDNIRDWILWALFSADRDTQDVVWEEELEDYLAAVEMIMGQPLEKGYHPAARSFRLTMDPVVSQHRPFLWYMVVGGIDAYMAAGMTYMGFRHFASPLWFQSFPPRPWTLFSRRAVEKDISYWYRPHKSTTKLPILFLHGIGIGIFMYMPFFEQLIESDPDVGIIAIEILSICNRITSPPLSASKTVDAIGRILDDLELPRVVVISHSYGTVVTAHLFRSATFAPRISATIFIDPIPFLLHLPTVAYNFVYRAPKRANEWQLHYFASRDPDISRTLSRHFFWTENVLWKEDLVGKRVAVVLSGEDQIVGAEDVRHYLTGEVEVKEKWTSDNGELDVLFFPGIDHATIFDSEERIRPVLDIAHRYVAGVAI